MTLFPAIYHSVHKWNNYCKCLWHSNDVQWWNWDLEMPIHHNFVMHRSSSNNKLVFLLNYWYNIFKVDLRNTIGQAADMGAAGIVMWGNRRDENTSPKVCHELNDYIKTKLGPYFESLRHNLEACSMRKCKGHGRCVDTKLILSKWMSDEPQLYGETCNGSPRTFVSYIRQQAPLLQQEGNKLPSILQWVITAFI